MLCFSRAAELHKRACRRVNAVFLLNLLFSIPADFNLLLAEHKRVME